MHFTDHLVRDFYFTISKNITKIKNNEIVKISIPTRHTHTDTHPHDTHTHTHTQTPTHTDTPTYTHTPTQSCNTTILVAPFVYENEKRIVNMTTPTLYIDLDIVYMNV